MQKMFALAMKDLKILFRVKPALRSCDSCRRATRWT